MKPRTFPVHKYDGWMWRLLCLLSQKKTYWWHWLPYADVPRPYTMIKGDPHARDEPNERETVVIVRPMLPVHEKLHIEWGYPGTYRVGFKDSKGVVRICTVIVPGMKDPTVVSATDVAFTVGKEDVELFAETFSDDEFNTGYPLRLQLIDRTTRVALSHPRYRNIILL